MAFKSSFPLFLALIVLVISSASCSAHKEEKMVVYIQEITGGAIATVTPVAGVNGSSSSLASSGTVGVIDDVATEGPERSSKVLGRLQGILANTDGSGYHLQLSLIFDYETSQENTIEIQGRLRSAMLRREYSVVGGTGRFRYARGYAVVDSIASAGFNVTFKFDIRLKFFNYALAE